MSGFKTNNALIRWIEYRLPIFSFINHSVGADYPSPRNLSYWWNFGSLAGFVLVVLILTGIILAMHYTAHVDHAFESVERIMRDVSYGWLLRYIHMNGASFFFIIVYIHVFRGLYYGSYKPPRELLWIIGVIILLLMMATAFMGYVLPWGQMSFWGAKVITNLFSAIPWVGEGIVTWLWGGFTVDNPTLNRFYSLHYLLPFLIVGAVILHIWALHRFGSNNPIGIDVKGPQDQIPFHPYYTVKDSFGIGVFLLVFCAVVFFAPNLLGEPVNYEPANPLSTPTHIVPEWYFLPYYAILRAIPSKLLGVIAMFASIFILFFLPWIDRSPVRSARFRPIYKQFFWIFLADCILLGYIGANPPEGWYLVVGRIATAYYFLHFVIVFILSYVERPRPLPSSIGEPVLKGGAPVALLGSLLGLGAAQAAEDVELPEHDWSFEGIFGHFDQAALQRGLQIYREVCAACHSLDLVAFRDLAALGYEEDAIKGLAAQYTVMDGPNDDGEMFERPGRPADRFPAPFPNDKAAAAANNGAVPPDLSLMAKAREGGATYLRALLTGYTDAPPAGFELQEGLNYNLYFPGHQIAMPPPLTEGAVSYGDGTEASVGQMASDVAAFLMWAAEPNLQHRKQMGVKTLLFLLVLTGLLYATKRKVWSDIH